MDTRIIHTRFWSDSYIMSLPLKGKMFFNYLITNERVNVAGVYELPEAYIKMHLGLTGREIQKYKQCFQEDGKFVFFRGWVRIVKFERYQKYAGELNDKAKERLLLLAPPEVLDTPSKGYDGSIDTSKNKQSEIINQKSEEGEFEGEVKTSSVLILSDPETITSLQEKFPTVDARTEIEKAKDWLEANGKRKKNYVAFARNWLRTATQDAKNKPSGMVYCPKCGKRILTAHQATHRCETGVSSFAQSLIKTMPTV